MIGIVCVVSCGVREYVTLAGLLFLPYSFSIPYLLPVCGLLFNKIYSLSLFFVNSDFFDW